MLEAPNAPPVLKVNGKEDAALLAPSPKPGADCCWPKMDPPVPKEELVEPNAGVEDVPNRLGEEAWPKTLAADDCPKAPLNAPPPKGAEACMAQSMHRLGPSQCKGLYGRTPQLCMGMTALQEKSTWPKAGVEAAPNAGEDGTPKAGDDDPKPKPPWAGAEEAPNREGDGAAPNAGVEAAPKAGVLACPKGALACVCPKRPPEVCPKAPPEGAEPVLPLHPACKPGDA